VIQKKVKAHGKKMKKLAKVNAKNGVMPHNKKALKKDPGIPNLFPFKAEMISRILKDKELAKQQKNKQPTLQHTPAMENKEYSEYEDAQSNSFFGSSSPADEMLSNKHQSAGAYFRELKKVLQECDVVLEVLDARDPMGCRCKQIEQRITEQSGKRLILVLNKIDLVPKEVAEGWIQYLRREFPTIAFKASTQAQRSNTAIFGGRLKIAGVKQDTLATSACVGANELIQLLKNYCRNRDIKTSITVGVVGYPNVGKSSIINSLKRSRAVGVASTAGYTKTVQEVHLDKNIKLLDSPGVIFFDDPNSTESSLALRNSLQLEKLQDPVGVVHRMVSKVPAKQLLQVFNLQSFSDADDFILKVAGQKGKLKKGGIPDLEATAISILRDWNDGKIPFFTNPPSAPVTEHVSRARVVMAHEFSEAEFDISALEKGDKIVTTLADDVEEAALPEVRNQTYALNVNDGDVEMQ
jgi:nuclear GTP-binding protein